ncbi:MAG: hypothetical protein PVG49_15050 [Desulfobacteraceae bacterium]|jgi:hypothetical protein
MNDDEQHLKLLSIFHYVVGGIGCFFACFPLIHVVIGALFLLNPESLQGNGGGPPSAVFGWLFLIMGILFFAVGQAASICLIVSGRFLARRKKYMFSFVFACVECIFIPFGTVLGIFTIVVLSRDSVKALYGRPVSQAAGAPTLR